MKHIHILLLTIVLAAPLCADEASHQQAARELLKASQAEKLMDEMMGQMDGIMDQSYAAAGLPEEAKAEWDEVKTGIIDWMAEFLNWKEMEPMYVEIYTSVFTEEELREITAFYQSPIGQKMTAKMPALTQKSMEITMDRMQKKMPELQNRMNEKIVELKKKYSTPESSTTSS